MMHNPDSQKNVEHFSRIEKDKLEERYTSKANQRMPWKYVGLFVAVVAIVLIALILI